MDITILAGEFYEYSKYIRGFSKATIRRYRYVIEFYVRHMGITKIEDVTTENLRSLFFYGRTERHWQTNTYVVFYKSLKVFLRWCSSKGLITPGLMDAIEVPKIEKRLPAKLTKQDALRLLEIVYNYPYRHKFLRYRNHAIYATFIFAGLRKQELLNLKLTDVDLENLTIYVRQGKGAKDRILPISYTLAQSLTRYLEERCRLKKTCPEFFTSLTHNMGVTEKGLNNFTCKIRSVLNVPFSVHKLRHTFATLMLEGGCDIYSLSRMMGHSDLKTTAIYLSASAEHLRLQIMKHPLNAHN
jgi:site-specific recombinase XerD